MDLAVIRSTTFLTAILYIVGSHRHRYLLRDRRSAHSLELMNLLLWLQNFATIAGLGLVTWIVIHGARSERWQRAWTRLRQDKIGIAAGIVIGIYLGIGALEMIEMPHGKYGSISILGWLTQGVPKEKSYSAPVGLHFAFPVETGEAQRLAPARHGCAGQGHLCRKPPRLPHRPPDWRNHQRDLCAARRALRHLRGLFPPVDR